MLPQGAHCGLQLLKLRNTVQLHCCVKLYAVVKTTADFSDVIEGTDNERKHYISDNIKIYGENLSKIQN